MAHERVTTERRVYDLWEHGIDHRVRGKLERVNVILDGEAPRALIAQHSAHDNDMSLIYYPRHKDAEEIEASREMGPNASYTGDFPGSIGSVRLLLQTREKKPFRLELDHAFLHYPPAGKKGTLSDAMRRKYGDCLAQLLLHAVKIARTLKVELVTAPHLNEDLKLQRAVATAKAMAAQVPRRK